MICPTCNSMLPDNAKFCGVCGNPVAQQAYGQHHVSENAYQNQQPQVPHDYIMPDPTNAVSQALSDIRSTPRWVRRIMLLAAMKFLPILGFFETGYALKWATTAWKNIPRDMPRYAFNKDEFLTGLFFWVIGILAQIGTGWLAICNIIPIAGTILWIVLMCQAFVFSSLAALRMAAYGRFGAAFDMSKIFEKLRLKSTGLYKAYFIPWLICLGIIIGLFVVAFIISALIGMALYSDLNNAISNHNFFMTFLISATRAIWVTLILGITVGLVSLFVATLTEIWAFRALGYWLGYYAFDWVCEANTESERRR